MDADAPEDETPEERAERERYDIRTNPDRDLCYLVAPHIFDRNGSPFPCTKSKYHKHPHSAIVGSTPTYKGTRPLRFRWPGEGPRSGERYPDALGFRRRCDRA